MTSTNRLLALVATCLGACGSGGNGAPATPDAAALPAADPFAPQPDTSEGLTNVSSDLAAVLENGALAGACDAYAADPQDRRKRLLCGKWQFFYEGFGTAGVPTALVTWAIRAASCRSRSTMASRSTS